MDKTVYSGFILISATLVIGSIWFPENAGMWLASTSLVMNLARIVLIGLMIGLLVTDPPRRRVFRMLLGVAAIGFMGWALGRLWSGSVEVMDALLFTQAAVAFGIAALEGQALVPATKPKSLTMEELFARNFATTSNMQGFVVPHIRLAEFVQRAIIIAAIFSGALSQNLRPYRALWRGG